MKKWGLLFIACFAIAGCSSKFVYNNLDWLLIEYVEDFVELDDEQEKYVSDKMEQLSEWHRREEIPNYIEHLDELMALDLKTFSEEDLQAQETKIQGHSQRIVARVAPEISQLAQQLTDEQVDELMNSIRVRHTKYKNKYQNLSSEQVRDKYAERISDNIDDWFGSVTDEQQQIIRNWTQDLYITSFDWIEHQTKMRVEINALLANRLNKRYFAPHFETLMFDSTSYYAPQLEQKIDHNRAVANRYLVKIINSATAKQTKYYKSELQDWKDIALDVQ